MSTRNAVYNNNNGIDLWPDEFEGEDDAPTSSSEGGKSWDLDKLSVKELKKFLTDKEVLFADCFEKSDLKRRVMEVLAGSVVPTRSYDVKKRQFDQVEGSELSMTHYIAIKVNKYNIHQRRTFVIDENSRTLRILDSNSKLKKEIAVDCIVSIMRNSKNPKRVELRFGKPSGGAYTFHEAVKAELQRNYKLIFNNSKERENFCIQLGRVKNNIRERQATLESKELTGYIGVSTATFYKGPEKNIAVKDEVVYWNISLLTGDDKQHTSLFKLEWNTTQAKIYFRDCVGDKVCWEFDQSDLRKINAYYSFAGNVLANVAFHSIGDQKFILTFENKLCVNDFVNHAKALLFDDDDRFKLLMDEGESK